ncbi:ABC transporter permease [Neorhizobium galegae]|uniref:ABC transporter permease n=1 Tax=Neorhizobium galegae TaxID=399 RepID=UPI0006227E6A|nr:ABC transporter permease [Neorhizobium galegae]CDZ60102.1 ABC-type spermidine/putrescine transport system, permease component I [Neorhizobium galegae bv. orientalis]KAB1121035.1 ABC transporter permease [Neorhizobium galegae]MCQ1574596.1 ABC transporter permease [Neorhizobium galegae]MCQ1808980.1 ABC transporter permease [Neorhizobium galegae]CDZ64747.1 ABC-type spermidine/putrescine transport system, permease component I [Neorhizobium galegae bv. orientalis]
MVEIEAAAQIARTLPRKRSVVTAWSRQRNRLTFWLMTAPMLSMAILFIAPILVLVWMSFGGGSDVAPFDGYKALLQPVYLRLLGFTLQLAFLSTIICAILSYPIAYLMANVRSQVNLWIAVALFISLWLSFLARTFSWIIILQRRGVVNNFLISTGLTDQPFELVYNKIGVYVGMIHILLPFMVITLIPAMKAIDPAYMRAALSLGASPAKVFRQIYLPLSLPGLVAGSMLVFTLAFGFFITPAILGGGRAPTIVLAIRDQIQQLGDLQLAASTSMVLLVICLALLIAYDRVSGVDRLYDRGGR